MTIRGGLSLVPWFEPFHPMSLEGLPPVASKARIRWAQKTSPMGKVRDQRVNSSRSSLERMSKLPHCHAHWMATTYTVTGTAHESASRRAFWIPFSYSLARERNRGAYSSLS